MTNYTDYIEITRTYGFEDTYVDAPYSFPCLVKKSSIVSIEPRTDDVNEKGAYIKTIGGDLKILAMESYADLKSALLYPSKKDQNAEKLYSEAFMACKKYNRSK